MRLSINSPLAPCELPDSGQLSPYQAIGIVTDLALNDRHYRDMSVLEIVARLVPALETGQAKVFFDDEHRPYAYASWAMLPDSVHQSLLASIDYKMEGELVHFFQIPSGRNLWFFDLLSPFIDQHEMRRILKHEINVHESAHLIQYSSNEHSSIQRVW